jgi:UDP-N-acetylmuramyl tripeptide synthase
LFYSIRKAKRFNKKKSEQDKRSEQLQKEEQDKIALLQDFYKYNVANAKAALKVLTGAQIESIRKRLEKGGAK